jgi:Trk K+ transport system NAD-binding subunit
MYINNFITLAMAAYFTAIVKAPITGSILITEMVGSFSHLLALTTVSITAYVVTDILKSKPIYEMLLERLLKNRGESKLTGDERNKVLLEIAVTIGSNLDRKMVRDIKWPDHCLLVALKRGEAEMIPKGDTLIYAGDYLIVLTNEDNAGHAKSLLLTMAGEKENLYE